MLRLQEFYMGKVPYPVLPQHRFKDRGHDSDSVYLFLNESNLLCKIGISGDTRSRLKQVQSACGQPIRVLLSIKLSSYDEDCKVVEDALHFYFKSKRRHGEWFDLNLKDVIEIRSLFWNTIEGEHIEDNLKDSLSDFKSIQSKPHQK